MENSILNSTKKVLGVDSDYDVFDADIIMHINSAFSILADIGLGPDDGFMIEDETPVWDDFILGNSRLNSAKSYVYLRVRLLFDPPATSFTIAAMEKQIEEIYYRLSTYRETLFWKAPNPESANTSDLWED